MFIVWTIDPVVPWRRFALVFLSRMQARRMQTNGTSQLPDQHRKRRTTSSFGSSHSRDANLTGSCASTSSLYFAHHFKISYFQQFLLRAANNSTPSTLLRHLLALSQWRALSCTVQCGSFLSPMSSSPCSTRWFKTPMSDVHICQTSR